MKTGNRKQAKLSAQDGKLLYEGDIITDDKTKQPLYDGPGYLFNNETKCFFKGTWRLGEKVCGIETFPNGDVYEGSYKEGKFHGRGLLYNNVQLYPNIKGQYRYDGQFELGQKQGFGKEQYLAGGYYEGQFKNNQKHGHGKLVFADDSNYEGDFQRGLPNGFGVQIAYSKQRIVAVFPIQQVKEKVVKKNNEDEELDEEAEKAKSEYVYEGEFVDGYKHGIGRLYFPSGSYYYAYWEYNKPARDFIYYEAAGNKWRNLNIKKLQSDTNINFFTIINETRKEWREQCPVKGNSYPPKEKDGYKSILDEKGLKREHFEDPDFDFSEQQFNIRDENGSPVSAPVDFVRFFTLEIYVKRNFKLFSKEIEPGYLQYQEQYCCQQLTVVLNALTYHSYLLSKVLSRKYEADTGFAFIKLFIKNCWREYVIDDLIPIFKSDKMPIFSNSPEQELAWVMIFKAFAKYYQSFTYFENDKIMRAEEYLTLLTGMPTISYKVPNEQGEGLTEEQQKLWRKMSQKFQKTKIRICYLNRDSSLRLLIPQITAYQIVDMQEAAQQNNKREESFYMVILASNQKLAIKTELQESFTLERLDKHSQTALSKLRERNPQMREKGEFFLIGYKDFLKYFGKVYMLCASKYPIQNQQLIIPEENDKYNFELRFFCRFSTNLPQDCLISVTQDHFENKDDLSQQQDKTFPIRIVLAKEKDLFTNKSQVKKKVTTKWQEKTIQSKLDKEKKGDLEKEEDYLKSQSLFEANRETKQVKPYKYMFGLGQSTDKCIFKDASLESGVYVLFIQVEIGDGREQIDLANLKFWVAIHGQQLLQIQKLDQQIQGFQRAVYESAVNIADKKSRETNNKIKYFHKGDLSEQENGSSDLVITQYFMKKEGTYLQLLNNRSNNKIWRQKLYFRLENMQIIDHRDTQKLDLQLSKKQTALVIIQQVGGVKKYNLEGGEGICIVDILHDANQEDDEGMKVEVQSVEEDNQENNNQQDAQKPKFQEALFKKK